MFSYLTERTNDLLSKVIILKRFFFLLGKILHYGIVLLIQSPNLSVKGTKIQSVIQFLSFFQKGSGNCQQFPHFG